MTADNKTLVVKYKITMVQKKIVFLFLLFTLILNVNYAKNREYYENIIKSFHEGVDARISKKLDAQSYKKAMEDLTEVIMYAKENKLYALQIDALVHLGGVYVNVLATYDKAMECYLEAYQLCLDKSERKDESVILNNIGVLYNRTNDFEKAIEYLNKGYIVAMEGSNNPDKVVLLNNLAEFYNRKGDLAETEKYIRIAMDLFKENPKDTLGIALFSCIKADYFFQKQQYDSLEKLSIESLKQNVGKRYQPLETEHLFLLSKMYHKKKDYTKAISYAKDAIESNIELHTGVKLYRHLSEVYRDANMYILAFQAQDSVFMLKDSLLQIKGASQLLSGQLQFDLNDFEKKLAETKAKQKRNQLVFIFVVVFIIAVSLLVLYLRSTKNKQLKMMVELEKNAKLLLEQQAKEREMSALLEHETYKNEIELKNRQLVSKTLSQLNKNELTESIIYSLSHIPNRENIPELQPIIKKLESQIKESTTWNSFFTYFEQTNPYFLATLKKKHPDLTVNDIRLSSYIYLNLDTKEIASMLQITSEYCHKKKQYLAQKLGIPTPKLYGYLAGIG